MAEKASIGKRVVERTADVSSAFVRSRGDSADERRGLRSYYFETLECGCQSRVHFSRCQLREVESAAYDESGDLINPLIHLGPDFRRCALHNKREEARQARDAQVQLLVEGSAGVTPGGVQIERDPETPAMTERQARRTIPSWRRVTRLQLAELLGIHPDQIWERVKNGLPILHQGGSGRGDESVFDAVVCLKWWRDNSPGSKEKDRLQTQNLELDRQRKQLELDKQRGLTVPIDQVVREGQAYTKGVTTELLALPRILIQHGIVPPEQEPQATEVCRDMATRFSTWKSLEDIERRVAELTSEDAA